MDLIERILHGDPRAAARLITMVENGTAEAVAVLKAIYLPLPLHLPMLAFALFGGFVQALIFTTLTAVYIGGAVQTHEDGNGHG